MDRRLLVVALALVLALSAACGGGGGSKTANKPPPSYKIKTLPTLKPGPASLAIMRPVEGAKIARGDVSVIASWGNFTVETKEGLPNQAKHGHVYYYMDLEALPTTPGRKAVPADPKKVIASNASAITWKAVQPGTHSFSAQLVNNDRTPLDPPVTTTVTVTVV